MSWISQNYEKAAVGVAALAAIGLAYTGWSKVGSVETDFSAEPKGKPPTSDASVKGSDSVSIAKSSFELKRAWTKGEVDGRQVDLFTGVALFVNKNDLLTPVDLIGKNVPPVHPPIPNKWWIETRIDPGFGDSPQRDADEDGFSNEDEYTAETDPNDIRDYPSLITKLSYVGDEFVKWVLKPGYPSAGGDFGFKYGDSLGRAERTSAAVPVMPGGLFFDDGPIKGRFKLISSEVRPVKNENFNSVVDTTFVIIEDQKPNKLGDKYEIPAQFRNSDADKYSKFDRTAILSLEALGLDGQEIKVEEFTSFALPPTSETKAYKLTEVTPDKITVERTAKDGKTETYVISKGSTGPDAP